MHKFMQNKSILTKHIPYNFNAWHTKRISQRITHFSNVWTWTEKGTWSKFVHRRLLRLFYCPSNRFHFKLTQKKTKNTILKEGHFIMSYLPKIFVHISLLEWQVYKNVYVNMHNWYTDVRGILVYSLIQSRCNTFMKESTD